MNAKILMVSMAVLSIGIAGTTATLSSFVYADASTPNGNNPNLFGKAASDLGQSGQMGDHSSDPLPLVPGRETPRSGIANIGNDLGITCGSKSPADLADILTGGTC